MRRPRAMFVSRWLGSFALLLLAACGSPPPALNAAQQAAANTSQSAARAWARGDLAQARALYERALAAAESVEDFSLAGAALLNLALVHQRSGDLIGAQARVDRLLAAPHRYGPALHAAAATRKALLYLDTPDLDAASAWAGRAEAACGQPCEHAAALANLRAHVAWQRGDIGGSMQQAEGALAAATPSGQAAEQANALRQLGRARAQAGQTTQAAADLAQALAIDQRLGLPERIALDLVFAGEVELKREQRDSAREFFERALAVYQAAGLTKPAEALRARLAAR